MQALAATAGLEHDWLQQMRTATDVIPVQPFLDALVAKYDTAKKWMEAAEGSGGTRSGATLRGMRHQCAAEAFGVLVEHLDCASVFGLRQRSQICCGCNPGVPRFVDEAEGHSCLALPLTHGSVGECLAEYTKNESLETPCSSCVRAERQGKVEKGNTLSVTGRVLVLQLKRFSFDESIGVASKNTNACTFGMTLSKCALTRSAIRRDGRLYAVIQHNGGLNSGHYQALVRYGEQWFRCNDGSVSLCSERSVLDAKKAYLLFYELDSAEDMVRATLHQRLRSPPHAHLVCSQPSQSPYAGGH